jgi:hypothetical protein
MQHYEQFWVQVPRDMTEVERTAFKQEVRESLDIIVKDAELHIESLRVMGEIPDTVASLEEDWHHHVCEGGH